MSHKDSFLHYLQVEKRYSAHTLLAYETDLDQFILFAEIKHSGDWKEVSHQLVRAWMVDLLEQKVTNKSVSRKISSLRSFFKWMRQEGHVAVNPMLKIRGPKVEKRIPQFVKESELKEERIDTLFSSDFDGIRDRLIFEMLYQTGVRVSELVDMKELGVTDKAVRVLGKRNKERVIPIGTELAGLIRMYRQVKPSGPDSQNHLFVKKDGVKLSSKFVYRKINSYLGSVTNVQKKSPHVMRHSFATHLLNNGAGLETLKELLGHANLSATQVYTHNSFAQINSIYSQAHPRGRKK